MSSRDSEITLQSPGPLTGNRRSTSLCLESPHGWTKWPLSALLREEIAAFITWPLARVLASKLNLTRLMRDSQLLLCHVLCAVALMLRSLTAITDSVAVLAILAILRAVATLR